jgi:hypothetical protein
MITLSADKISSFLSIPGNNKCLECDNTSIEWVSFPTSIFLCQSCSREHKSFTKKETIKCLSIDEFTENELSKLSIGGNDRFLTILKEYNIDINNPNKENKYLTFAAAYYNALLEAEINKNNKISGAEETLNLLISKKPLIEVGSKLMGDTADYYKELVESANNNKKSGFGGFFSFLGNQVYNVAESLGINKVYNDTKNTIDNKLNEYGIKDKMVKGVDYAKSAGGYLVDKGKEIANTNIVQGAVNKVKDGVEFVNNSAINLFNNINQIGIDNNNESKNEHQNNNLDFLNEENNNNNIYQQLSNDQM